MKLNIGQVIVASALIVTAAAAVRGQGVERYALGVNGTVWSVPDLDRFSVVIGGAEEGIEDTVLYGVRPFVRLGLSSHLALEVSHEFAFGDDVDVMVSSGSGIWNPFGGGGLELHASICFGQFDWDGPGNFNSAWGWEVGGAYSFRISNSVRLLIGIAYRDLSFDYDLAELLVELAETAGGAEGVTVSEGSADSAGAVGNIGLSVTF